MVFVVAMLRLMFSFLLFACIGCGPCFSTDSGNVPTKEQVQKFQRGDFEEFAAYIKSFGKANRAVMACVYKVSWQPPEKSVISKGTCAFQATVVESNDAALPVGRKVEWVIYVEEPDALPAGQVAQWTALPGEIVYIVNPPVDADSFDSARASLFEPVYFIVLGASPVQYGHAAMFCGEDEEEE